ncbi:hypothetical protein M426DRAFT_58716 [Hypoxylon sp. CI-4A]|nr:hypothetical protein M426DRAFT_58716 [Hypoxylon sp. CI-4A]
MCSTNSFQFPNINGTSPISITAAPIYNHTASSLPPGTMDLATYTISFCNVSVTYTHTDAHDAVNVQVWLPFSDSWNGRLQAVGGAGYSASVGSLYMTQAVGKGYIALDTDAGHLRGVEYSQTPETWALESPGNVNLQLLDNWGSTSLHEMAVIGKAVSASYYGTEPTYSYFNGCSGGGRQAMMLAERYAEDFDGLMAGAPALSFNTFGPAGYWAAQVATSTGAIPASCEIEAFTTAAVDACDGLDGVSDGIISLPALCKFNPHDIVGQEFSCNGTTNRFSEAGANIAQAAWTGPKGADGKIGWFGLNKDADLASYSLSLEPAPNGTYKVADDNLFSSWIRYFSAKDPDWNASAMSNDQFFQYIQQSTRDYGSSIAASNPNLSAFQAAGGKIITWHGLADEAIPPNGTIAFMEQVIKLHPNSDEFIRFYEAPGVGHCSGGSGAAPEDAFGQLVSWVENGTVPTTLAAVDSTGSRRELCTFPLQQVYLGGNISDSASFGCRRRNETGTLASEALFYSSA